MPPCRAARCYLRCPLSGPRRMHARTRAGPSRDLSDKLYHPKHIGLMQFKVHAMRRSRVHGLQIEERCESRQRCDACLCSVGVGGTWEYKPGLDYPSQQSWLCRDLFSINIAASLNSSVTSWKPLCRYTPTGKSYAAIRYHQTGAYPTYNQPLLFCLDSWGLVDHLLLTPHLHPQTSRTSV